MNIMCDILLFTMKHLWTSIHAYQRSCPFGMNVTVVCALAKDMHS